jgi:hypothetical protein
VGSPFVDGVGKEPVLELAVGPLHGGPCVFGQEKMDKMVVRIPYSGTVRKYSLLSIFQYPPSLS